MIILQANQILSQVHWTLRCLKSRDELGNPVPQVEYFLARHDGDATSALSAPVLTDMTAALLDRAESVAGLELGYGWHDLI